MEFSLPLELDADSLLSKRWSHFHQRFLYYQKTSALHDPWTNIVSVLLFAGRNEIDNMCASLKMYDIDFIKLNKILEVVEKACMPNFVLLFERFHFFTLEPEPSETESDTISRLNRQAEICQFGTLRESILTEAITRWMSDQKLQHVANVNLNQADRSGSELNAEKSSNIPPDNLSNSVTKRPKLLQDEDSKQKTTKRVRKRGRKPKHSRQQQKSCKDKKYAKCVDTESESSSVTLSTNQNGAAGIVRIGKVRNIHASGPHPDANSDKQPKKDKSLICFVCGKAFAGIKWLQNHFTAHHPNCEDFSCTFCDEKWENVTDYANHFALHFPELEHKKVRARRLSATRRSSHTLSCHLCSAKFSKEALLRHHMSNKHPNCHEFICAHCSKLYTDFKQYLRHTKRVHNLQSKMLTCDLCQAKFFQRKRLSIHLRKHLDLRQHQCEQCGKAYNERQMLVAHLRLHSSTKSHKCDICGKNFLAVSLLTKHMRSHTGEKPYTCELCGKSYSDISAFQYHQHWHAGEQPYACEICGKRTRSVGEKNKHKRVHSDKKPYVCEYCGKAFRFISNLIEHRKGHSGKRVHICNICGQSFIYRSGLTRHLQLRCPGNKNLTRRPRNSSAPHPAVTTAFPSSHPRPENQNLAGTSQDDFLTWHSMITTYGMEGSSSVVLVPQFG